MVFAEEMAMERWDVMIMTISFTSAEETGMIPH